MSRRFNAQLRMLEAILRAQDALNEALRASVDVLSQVDTIPPIVEVSPEQIPPPPRVPAVPPRERPTAAQPKMSRERFIEAIRSAWRRARSELDKAAVLEMIDRGVTSELITQTDGDVLREELTETIGS
jgi:hypothetical protein